MATISKIWKKLLNMNNVEKVVEETIKPRVLFICKNRNAGSGGPSFGLINSCRFICNALIKYGIEAEVVSVVDNNCIDREVTKFKPTHCFIEALWVVPDKFKQLIPLHPEIKWYVRIHSKIPFIANEGISIEWLKKYHVLSQDPQYSSLNISANSLEPIEAFREAYNIPICYHPNVYCPVEYKPSVNVKGKKNNIIDIGCFGAVRPMKNQLLQAISTIKFGNDLNKTIRFHINGDRIEQKGDPILKNIENAFVNTKHELVKHPWMNHEDFINVIKTMDLGLQVSFSETFNIVAADFVNNNIPIVGSEEIEWLSSIYKANTNNMEDIVTRLRIAWFGKSIGLQKFNKTKLDQYNYSAISIWLNSLK